MVQCEKYLHSLFIIVYSGQCSQLRELVQMPMASTSDVETLYASMKILFGDTVYNVQVSW